MRYRGADADEDATTPTEEEDECDATAQGPLVYRHGARVYFHCEVNRRSVARLIEALDSASRHAVADGTGVTLYIHSEGGDVFAGLSAMQHVARCAVKVTAVVDGFVASAATFILLGAGHRRMGPHDKVLIHQMRSGVWGKYTDVLDEVKNMKDLMKSIRRVYRQHTHMDKETVRAMLGKELALNAKQCLEFHIVHAITD